MGLQELWDISYSSRYINNAIQMINIILRPLNITNVKSKHLIHLNSNQNQ